MNFFIESDESGFDGFEFVGDVALFVGEGLLAGVVGRCQVRFAARNADVVAKGLGKAYFEVRDAGAGAFGGLQVGDPLFVGGGY